MDGGNMIVHIFKCPTCGAEWERTEEEMKGLKTVFCGSCDAWSACDYDRIEVRNAAGERTAVIV